MRRQIADCEVRSSIAAVEKLPWRAELSKATRKLVDGIENGPRWPIVMALCPSVPHIPPNFRSHGDARCSWQRIRWHAGVERRSPEAAKPRASPIVTVADKMVCACAVPRWPAPAASASRTRPAAVHSGSKRCACPAAPGEPAPPGVCRDPARGLEKRVPAGSAPPISPRGVARRSRVREVVWPMRWQSDG